MLDPLVSICMGNGMLGPLDCMEGIGKYVGCMLGPLDCMEGIGGHPPECINGGYPGELKKAVGDIGGNGVYPGGVDSNPVKDPGMGGVGCICGGVERGVECGIGIYISESGTSSTMNLVRRGLC